MNIFRMKYLFSFCILSFFLTSCFKDKPLSEFAKVAGSWKIKTFTVQKYDTVGVATDKLTYDDIGYLFLNYNEGESAQNTFGYSLNTNTDFASNSLMFYTIGLCDRWDVSVGAKHMNFGYFDPVANGTVQVITYSITKINSRKMHWMRIFRHPSGALASMETAEMTRGN